MKLKGYNDAKIIGKRDGRHVVAVSSYDNLNAAKEMLSKIRKEVIDTAWILNSKK